MDDEPQQRMRLDALAAAAGVATTTIRLYQQRGLLPGPDLVGRTGWYGPEHLARLRLIATLQQQGHSLAGIKELVDSWEAGRDLGDIVGLEASLDRVLHQPTTVELDPAELMARFPADALTPDAMQRAAASGLVDLTDDGRVRVPDVRFLDIGADLVELGVPVDVVLDEWSLLRTATDEIARRFVAVFEQHLLPAGWRDDLDDLDLAEVAATLARLQRDAGSVLLAALDASMRAEGARRLRELVDEHG